MGSWINTFLPMLGIAVGAVLQFLFSRSTERDKRLDALRTEAYADYLRSVSASAHLTSEKDFVDALRSAADAKTRIAVYGSTDTIEALTRFEEAGAQLNSERSSGAFMALISAMRGKKSAASEHDIRTILLGTQQIAGNRAGSANCPVGRERRPTMTDIKPLVPLGPRSGTESGTLSETEKNDRDPEMKRFDVAVQIRNFEIELFWKRSIFFWGFIASIFAGYILARPKTPDLAILLASFGVVCSTAWTLLNRGSKYWQESWETKVNMSESEVVGTFFAKEEPRLDKGWWLSARKYSVSKLAIAMSDFVSFVWCVLLVSEVVLRYAPKLGETLKGDGPLAFAVLSLVYAALLLVFGRKSPPQ